MSAILKTYALTFSIKQQKDGKTGLCDTTNASYTTLANFIYEVNWSSEAEKVITALNNVLNQQNQNEEFQTHYLLVEAKLTNTMFVDIDNPQGFNNPDLTIPTVDFKDIMIEWKNFLQKIGI